MFDRSRPDVLQLSLEAASRMVAVAAYVGLHLCTRMYTQSRSGWGSTDIRTGLVVVCGDEGEHVCVAIPNHDTLQVDRCHSPGCCLSIVVENSACEHRYEPSSITLQENRDLKPRV